MVINCIKIADNILNQFENDLKFFTAKKIIPHMVIIKINDDLASAKYVNIKVKKATELGIKVTVIGDQIKNQEQLISKIKELNSDNAVHGYIIQLPLPVGFDKDVIFEQIDINKDIDGLSSVAIARNIANSKLFYPKPCTANGIIEIMKQSNYEIQSKNIVIINRSMIVGKPLIGLLLKENATVTVCHTKTKDLKAVAKRADVIICAVGVPNFIDKQMVNPNSFVIDAGISVVNQKVVGDANFAEIGSYVKYITPVPNGVGKLTVAMLFSNLMELVKESYQNGSI